MPDRPPTVPADVASWGPRVHSLASQVLHGGISLNSHGSEESPRRDRDELRSALAHSLDRLTVAVRGDSVLESVMLRTEAALKVDDLDAALWELSVADDHRRRLGDLKERPVETGLDRGHNRQTTAVSNAWRSDLTAAAAIATQMVDDDGPVTGPLRDEEVALLERVDPEQGRTARQVGGRADWAHRRPERAMESTPGRHLGRSDR